MAEQTSRKGGRPWFGKAEATAAGRVTRRRDGKVEIRGETLETIWYGEITDTEDTA